MISLISDTVATISLSIWAITVLTDINYMRKRYNKISDSIQYLRAGRNIIIHKK